MAPVRRGGQLPAGKVLIPGMVTHSNVMIEHPEAVADRIVRWASTVGPENLIVGNDCGFASTAGNAEIPPTVAWAKLHALGDGAPPRLGPAMPLAHHAEPTKGPVRIRYAEAGSGFPVLVIPGGGLNSRLSYWASGVYNFFDGLADAYHVVTMDQRNANEGEWSGPVPASDPWGAFAADQLGLMDHLGIDQFVVLGCCIGGPFALKLMELAPRPGSAQA